MTKVLFKEEQRYKKPRIAYIVTAVAFILIIDIVVLVRQILYGNQDVSAYGDDRIALIIVTFILVAFTFGFIFIFTRMKLITVVTDKEIQVFYPPLFKKGRFISKEEIHRFEVRQYNPIHEFGGWGYKYRGRLMRRKRFGVAFTAYGRTGVQLHLKSGKKILIGTQRTESIKYALTKMLEGHSLHSGDKDNK